MLLAGSIPGFLWVRPPVWLPVRLLPPQILVDSGVRRPPAAGAVPRYMKPPECPFPRGVIF